MYPNIYKFTDAFIQAKEFNNQNLCNQGIRLLVGNGFTQAFYRDFSYTTLFDAIEDIREDDRLKTIFSMGLD